MKVTREQQQKTTERLAGASAPPAARPPVIGEERDVEVHRRPVRNPGAPLDLESVRALRVNRSAVERRAATIPTRRTVKKQWQAAWLLRAITCMDLTTLQGDDTPGNVLRLCAKARRPLRDDLVDALGVAHLGLKVGAVCVYHALVPVAAQALAGSGIPVAAVSTGFPAGLSPSRQRVEEIHASLEAGAREIDVVITRAHVLTGNWEALYDEVRTFRAACGDALLKVILGTGELATLTNVARASRVAMLAGADFIKTSTGKEPVNATLPVGVVMVRQIREYAPAPESDKPALEWLAAHGHDLGIWVGGRWIRGTDGKLFDVITPASTQRLARVVQAGAADVDAAVRAAREALPGWAALPGHA